MHRLISSGLHLSVFGPKTISSDKGQYIFWTHFNKKMSEHRYDIRVSESYADPNP